jgi:hypothetical protein
MGNDDSTSDIDAQEAIQDRTGFFCLGAHFRDFFYGGFCFLSEFILVNLFYFIFIDFFFDRGFVFHGGEPSLWDVRACSIVL